jgi:microcystin-dependent protein
MDTYLGDIFLFAFQFAPVGWMSCEGQILNISQNSALYALIGAQYGGDGINTFALPNLNSSSPLPGMKYYMAIQGIFPSRP